MPLLLDAVNFQFSLWRRFRTTADDDDNNNENDNRQHTNFDQKSSVTFGSGEWAFGSGELKNWH